MRQLNSLAMKVNSILIDNNHPAIPFLNWRHWLTSNCELRLLQRASFTFPSFTTCFQASGKAKLQDQNHQYCTGTGETAEMLLFGRAWSITVGLRQHLRCTAEMGSFPPTESSNPRVSWLREEHQGRGKKTWESKPTAKPGECFPAGSPPWSNSPWSEMSLCPLQPVSTQARGHESVAKAKASTREEKGSLFGEQLGLHHHRHKTEPYLNSHQMLWEFRAARGRCTWNSWDHGLTCFVYISLSSTLLLYLNPGTLFLQKQSRALGKLYPDASGLMTATQNTSVWLRLSRFYKGNEALSQDFSCKMTFSVNFLIPSADTNYLLWCFTLWALWTGPIFSPLQPLNNSAA